MWSLLPSFCNFPSDTAESFNDLKQALCNALRDEPEIRGIICLSLQILVQQNKNIVEEVNDLSDSEVGTAKQRAMANYTPQVMTDNLSVLKSSAREILTVLSGVFLNSTKDDGGCLQVSSKPALQTRLKFYLTYTQSLHMSCKYVEICNAFHNDISLGIYSLLEGILYLSYSQRELRSAREYALQIYK